MQPRSSDRIPALLLIAAFAVLLWSGIGARDWRTWIMEVFPAIAAVIVLLATYRRFRFSNLAYLLIFIHISILCIGGHWTYANVPLFSWLRDEFGLSRNYYDRIGHFAQGFVPAILAREILLRTSPLRRGKWLTTIVLSISLAISALYELLEAGAAFALRQRADLFLALQGDVWDTQWDMFTALIGATAALLLLSRVHDRSLLRILRPE
jgi:putative membrane protein